MKEISEESKARFLEEVGICLKRGGFQVGPVEEGVMPVYWRGVQLCRVNGGGGIRYRSEAMREADTEAALERVADIVNVTGEYMFLLENAPALKADGLGEGYRLLNEFNGAVLAAHHSSRQGWEFVTWLRDHSGEGVALGITPAGTTRGLSGTLLPVRGSCRNGNCSLRSS